MRITLLWLAFLFCGCDSLFTPFAIDNPENCHPHPELCGDGTMCDQDTGRCVPTEPGPPISSLRVSGGTLSPAFSIDTTVYSVALPALTGSVQIAVTLAAGVTAEVNGAQVASDVDSAPIAIGPILSMITVVVHEPGQPDRSYGVVAQRTIDYLKAGNTGAIDIFGDHLSLSGDTLAVGAIQEDSNAKGINGDGTDNSAVDSGAVYIFRLSGSPAVWAQEAYIKASNTDAGDFFGISISLSGDTLAVGAHQEDSSSKGVNQNDADNTAVNSGAAYVFVRSGTTWTQQAYIKASNTDAGDRFGFSVSLDGDTLAVGALFESSNSQIINMGETDNTAGQSGAAYVFLRSGTTWTQQAYIKASNADPADVFGSSISLSGDTLAIGAPAERSISRVINVGLADNTAGSAGAAYVFTRSGTAWTQQAYIKASNADVGDRFGEHLSLSGDLLAVGAIHEACKFSGVGANPNDNSAPDAGAAYVFVRNGITWTQQAYIKASNAEASDLFGIDVTLSGQTLVVGSSSESSKATGVNGDQTNNSLSQAGAAYVFKFINNAWVQTHYLKATNPDVGDLFGNAVTVSGSTVVVGSKGEGSKATGVNGDQADNSVNNSGAVYVFR